VTKNCHDVWRDFHLIFWGRRPPKTDLHPRPHRALGGEFFKAPGRRFLLACVQVAENIWHLG
jgi:hypothetical protein